MSLMAKTLALLVGSAALLQVSSAFESIAMFEKLDARSAATSARPGVRTMSNWRSSRVRPSRMISKDGEQTPEEDMGNFVIVFGFATLVTVGLFGLGLAGTGMAQGG